MLSWLKQRRRRQIQSREWPPAWTEVLLQNARLCRRLNADQMVLMQQRAKVILAEKHWESAAGLAVSEEMKVTIAGQAALMLLGADDFYFDNVPSIVVLPDAFQRDFRSGFITEQRYHAGEAWQGGPVILSWPDVLSSGTNTHDGHNLIVHEFAHTLDGLDGEMGGNVHFADRATMDRWEEVKRREFQALGRAAQRGQRTLLDHYGASNEAEFFAVASEVFFELPEKLKEQHFELFELLLNYYRVDPSTWQRVKG